MSNKQSNYSKGIGFFTILFLIFLVMKLGEIGVVKDWSWTMVTCPLWSPIVAVLGIYFVVLLTAMIGIALRPKHKSIPKESETPKKRSRFDERMEAMKKQQSQMRNN